MNYSEYTELTNYPTAMQEAGFDNVHEAMQHFFSFFTVSETRTLLWEFFREWICGEYLSGDSGNARSKGIFFYEQLGVLIEAAYILQKKRCRQKKNIHHLML